MAKSNIQTFLFRWTPAPAFVFLLMYTLMFVFTLVPSSALAVDELRSHINLYGITFHFASVLAFIAGSHAGMYGPHGRTITGSYQPTHPRLFGWMIIAFCMVSIGIVYWQMSLSTSLAGYLYDLPRFLEQDAGTIKRLFSRQREAGGLPGIIKMFSYLPLAALYMIIARDFIREDHVFNHVKTQRYKTNACILLVLLTVLVRSVFTLDRGMVCAAFVVIFYYAVFNADKYYTCMVHSKRKKLLLASVLAVTVVFSHLLSYVRQGIGFKDVLAQYSSLGLCSLSLMFNSDFDYSLGLNLGKAITFPLDYFGLSQMLPDFTPPDWVWSQAKYLTAYAYNDWGLASVLFFVFFGFAAARVYRRVRNTSSPTAMVLLLAIIVAITSSIAVPFFRGPEWWFSLLAALLGVKLTTQKKTVSYIE